ncbi:unnamed protein product [Ixodes hexagonus]
MPFWWLLLLSGLLSLSQTDALLADLQQTTANLSNGGSPMYTNVHRPLGGPLNNDLSSTRTVTTERYDYKPTPDKATSPIYQNQYIMREVTTTTTKTSSPSSPKSPRSSRLLDGAGSPPAPRRSPIANNLSELDNLLEDLNTAKFPPPAITTPSPPTSRRRVVEVTHEVSHLPNGQRSLSPTSPVRYRPPSSPRSYEMEPTMEHLLDDLQSAVPHSTQPSRPPPPKATRTYTSPTPTASSATKELDDLMASLSDFNLNGVGPQSPIQPQHLQQLQGSPTPVSDPAYAKPHRVVPKGNRANQLDSMLGTLQSDLTKQGVNTTAKGHCSACNKPIVGQVVTALGRTWHPEHFTCAHCNQELGTKNFFERDNEPYCETDYHNIFSPRCAYCNGPILDKCVTALDKTWHPEHFFCAQCGKQFGEGGFHEKDGKPYCKEDYFELFAPKCGGCNRPITENYISALNGQWHPECFVCRDCRQPFNGGSFYDHEGQPYCETHYHAKRGSLCAGCHKPITGRCITAMFRKYHPEHFVCSFCLGQLNKGTFKEQNDKPYCHACFEKLFG